MAIPLRKAQVKADRDAKAPAIDRKGRRGEGSGGVCLCFINGFDCWVKKLEEVNFFVLRIFDRIISLLQVFGFLKVFQ